ncbi:MAG TPA: iron-containing alcohol dehydrogenase [Armatimonadota bacterium]|jgi:alcohol dehydrogenase
MPTFYNPVRLVTGEGTFDQLGVHAAKYGSHALIVTGRGAMEAGGFLARAQELLTAAGVASTVYRGVRPNPTDEGIREAAALVREHGCDLVIGLGGGSAMDTAKGVAVAATHDRDIDDFLLLGPDGKKAAPGPQTLPLICVTSTAGTSSQLTPYAVISAVQARVKTALGGDAIYPRVAICDPELTYSVPPRVTAATGVDVLCHSVEAYFSRGASPMTDLCVEKAVALVAEFLPRAVADGTDREARRAMSEADVFAGYPLSNCGGTIIHAIEHPLSAHYPELPHGEGLAALLPSYARVFAPVAGERFVRLAALLGGSGDLAEALGHLLDQVGLHLTLADVGVREDSLAEVEEDTLRYNRGTLARMPLTVGAAEVRAMLEQSYR